MVTAARTRCHLVTALGWRFGHSLSLAAASTASFHSCIITALLSEAARDGKGYEFEALNCAGDLLQFEQCARASPTHLRMKNLRTLLKASKNVSGMQSKTGRHDSDASPISATVDRERGRPSVGVAANEKQLVASDAVWRFFPSLKRVASFTDRVEAGVSSLLEV